MFSFNCKKCFGRQCNYYQRFKLLTEQFEMYSQQPIFKFFLRLNITLIGYFYENDRPTRNKKFNYTMTNFNLNTILAVERNKYIRTKVITTILTIFKTKLFYFCIHIK